MGYPMMISNRNAITFYLVYLQLFFFLLFPFVCVHAEIGSGHIADFKDVFEGLSGGRLEELQKTITSKIIDMPPDRSFLEGFSCGTIVGLVIGVLRVVFRLIGHPSAIVCNNYL